MLTVRELQEQRHAKARVNHDTYKLLLRQVQDRLRARAENKCTDMVWSVPPFVPGRPVYTTRHAARYVSEKLRRGGFDVSVASSEDVHILYVTWSFRPDTAATRMARPQSSPRDTRHTPNPPQQAMHDATRSLEKLKARLALV